MLLTMLQKISRLTAAFILCCAIVAPLPASAADVLQVCDKPEAKDSLVCREKAASDGKSPIFGPDGILTIAIKFLSIIVAIAATITIIVAGLKYITSGSNPQDVTKARELVLYAVVGLIIAGFAQAIVRFFLNTIQ